ncbi:MAG: GNAT family N-acetyltransferase, partial [Saprospiraceae bacterium]|nr:GNAT family N-acetyltransferase [Saprospiraceae bacterium]
MKVSRAILSDLLNICKLANNAYRGEEAKKGWTFESDFIEGDKRTDENDLFLLFSNEKAVFLIAKNDKEVVTGSVYLEVKNENLYMGMLSVEPTLQGNGIGKLLVSNAIQYGKSLGLEKIQIQVIHLRQELILWYEKLGFITSEKILPFEVPFEFGKPKVPLHFIEMHRT